MENQEKAGKSPLSAEDLQVLKNKLPKDGVAAIAKAFQCSDVYIYKFFRGEFFRKDIYEKAIQLAKEERDRKDKEAEQMSQEIHDI